MKDYYIQNGVLVNKPSELNPINYIGSPNIQAPFESMLLNKGRIPYWELHLNRIYSYLGKDTPLPFLQKNKLFNETFKLINQYSAENGKIKIVLDSKNKEYHIGFKPYVNSIEERANKPLNIHISNNRLEEYSLKSKCSLYGIQKKCIDDNYDEVLLLNNEGLIAEGLFSNLIFIKDNCLYYVHEDKCMLIGIMQNQIIEIAKKNNIQHKEVNGLSLNDLKNVDMCALCNSVQGFRIIDKISSLSHKIEYTPKSYKIYHFIVRHLTRRLC